MAASVRDEVRNQIAAYCQLLDDGLFDEFELLWTEDALVHVRGDVYDGRRAIRLWMEKVQPESARGRHLVANTRFVSELDDGIECVSDFVFFARNPKGGWLPSASGRYVDRWTNREGPWRIAERRIEM
jgi:3-phenylpropionate/cinnamic acid dioxygenase small subunit